MRKILLRSCIILVMLSAFLAACSITPEDRDEARSRNIIASLLSSVVNPGNSGLGPWSTGLFPSQKTCEGSLGSVLPPLTIDNCLESPILTPLMAITETVNAITRPLFDSVGLNNAQFIGDQRGKIVLQGIEKFWVKQSEDNNCWAAALEAARAYRGLKHLTQEQITEYMGRFCPTLNSQAGGADAYQVLLAIVKILLDYDGKDYNEISNNLRICQNSKCIIESLERKHPVIMLKSGHASLIVGAYFRIQGDGRRQILSYQILDPASEKAQIEDKTAFWACSADALISF